MNLLIDAVIAIVVAYLLARYKGWKGLLIALSVGIVLPVAGVVALIISGDTMIGFGILVAAMFGVFWLGAGVIGGCFGLELRSRAGGGKPRGLGKTQH